MERDLDDIFASVRKRFFPRWDKTRKWNLQWGTYEQLRGNTGYCDTKARVIYLDRRPFSSMTTNGQIALVIHEICHDTGAAFHNQRWAVRIAAAATVAEKDGDLSLADQITNEILGYFPGFLERSYCLEDVREYASERAYRQPNLTTDEAIDLVAKAFRVRRAKVRSDFGEDIHERCIEASRYHASRDWS